MRSLKQTAQLLATFAIASMTLACTNETAEPTASKVQAQTTTAWTAGSSYAAGDLVTYGGETYSCIQGHTALTGWEPPNVPALWLLTESPTGDSGPCGADPANCCPEGMAVQELSANADVLQLTDADVCVVALGGNDTVQLIGNPGATSIIAGPGHDTVQTGSADDIVHAGWGNDTIFAFDGSDEIHGSAGDDTIFAGNGDNLVYPGPGRDTVSMGTGDDRVVIFDICEVEHGETIAAGTGNDTLVTPVPLDELASLGVTVSGFENVVVQARPCLSECVPTCVNRVDPASITPIDGADLGTQGCSPLLDVVNGQFTEVPRNPNDPDHCPEDIRWCDADGNEIEEPTMAEINSAPPPGSTCPAFGTDLTECPIVTESLHGTCSSDSDCSGSEECVAVCQDAACSAYELQCGERSASCERLPEEDNCEEYFICPDPGAVGVMSQGEFEGKYTLETAPQPTAAVEEAAEAPGVYPPIGDKCVTPPAPILPGDTTQEQTQDSDEGSSKWGFYKDHSFSYVQKLDGANPFGSEPFRLQSGGRAGVGVKIWGGRLDLLYIEGSASAAACGLHAFTEVRLVGETIASYTPSEGFQWYGLGELPDLEWDEDQHCNGQLDEYRNKRAVLRSLSNEVHALREHWSDKGPNKEVCETTNARLRPLPEDDPHDCENILDPANDQSILRDWEDEYRREHDATRNVKFSIDSVGEAKNANLDIPVLDLGEQYSLAAFETQIPFGPVTVVLAAEVFGFWEVDGTVNVAIQQKVPQSVIDNATKPEGWLDLGVAVTSTEDVRARAGVTVAPGAGISAAVFAGVGIPGVTIGIEGQILIYSMSIPITAGVGVASVVKPDPRDRSTSAWAGDTCGLPADQIKEWLVPWDFGASLTYRALDGRVSLAVRVSLLFFKKTFRKKLAEWEGINNEDNPLVLFEATGDITGEDANIGKSGDHYVFPCDLFDEEVPPPAPGEWDPNDLENPVGPCIIVR